MLAIFISCGSKEEKQPEIPEKPKDSIFYGFNFNHFEVVRDTVRDGDSFGAIMAQHQVAYPEVHAATQKEYREIFDVRRLRQGQPYVILKSKDSIQKPQVFIYERDKINFSVIDFRQDLKVYSEQREIITHIREASGVINSSLSETILDQGMDYDVTHNLASIYAWTIDFFQLQEGDRFKVIYEERFIKDSTYAGMGPIKAAVFEHAGKTYYAFRHQADKDQNYAEYFDEKGNNLRRAFLQAPVNFSRISSRYNLKRKIAFYGNKVRPHLGTDYAASVGTPILATANGKVIVQYPPSRPCRVSEAHGITCDAEANRAILALAAADPLPVRVTEEIPEVIAEESEPPPNPFEALRQRAANGQASDVISAEDQRRFRPRRINADQVPDGMRVVSTPFGDRLVDI